MVRRILLLIVMMSTLASYSQTVLSGGISVSKSDTIQKNILDYGDIIVTYRYAYSPNPEKLSKKKHGFTNLVIGNRYNLFQDYYKMQSDSVYDTIIKRGGGFIEVFGEVLNIKKKQRFEESILYDRQTGKNSIFGRVGKDYRYEESSPQLEWNIVEGDTVIAGYNCNKALTHYAGRDYEAWFTPELELPYGPFKFNGLPGLVLYVSDTVNNYRFSLYSIMKIHGKKPIYEYSDKDIVKTKRDKFRKLYKNYCADPLSVHIATGLIIRSEDDKKGFKPHPYNPIELE